MQFSKRLDRFGPEIFAALDSRRLELERNACQSPDCVFTEARTIGQPEAGRKAVPRHQVKILPTFLRQQRTDRQTEKGRAGPLRPKAPARSCYLYLPYPSARPK